MIHRDLRTVQPLLICFLKSTAKRDQEAIDVESGTDSKPAGCKRPPEQAAVRAAVPVRVCLDPRVARVGDFGDVSPHYYPTD